MSNRPAEAAGYFPRVARGTRSYPRPDAAGPTLGFGVVGLHEGRTALMATDRTGSVRSVAACDTDPATRAAIAADFPEIDLVADYAELLAHPGVDVVGIYTPDHLHGEQIERAFAAGKAVVCTKPVVNTIEDARRVLAAARRYDGRLIVGQSTRFFDSFRRQRRAFEAGEVGALELVETHYLHRMDWYYATRPWVARSTDWIFLGLSHPLDLLSWYLGEIESVSAMGSTSALARAAGATSFDIYAVTVRSADGRLGRAMGHYGAHELASARNSIECVLWGDAGSSLAQYHDMRYVHTLPDGTEVTEDSLYEQRHFHFNNEVHGMHYGEFANYIDHFGRALLDGTGWHPTLAEGLGTFAVMEAARRSAQADGVPVPVAPIRAEIGL